MEAQGFLIAGADRKHFNLQNAETPAGTVGRAQAGKFYGEKRTLGGEEGHSGWTPLLVE